MTRFSIFIAALAAVMPAAALAQTRPAACDLPAIATAPVARVSDGRTLVLTDGREVRLAGLELAPPDSAESITALEALRMLVSGQALILKAAAAKSEDRYGRLMAFVSKEDGISVQTEMLRHGHARVAARGITFCHAELFSAEREARENARGLWANARFAARIAERPEDILAEKGQFTRVEGKILSVRESGATIYMNFGRRCSRDFTVTILRRNQRVFSAAGITPKSLEGPRIRVRGVVEQRGGPVIEASRPEQIELTN